MGDTIMIIILMIAFCLLFFDVYNIRKNTDEIVKLNKEMMKKRENL